MMLTIDLNCDLGESYGIFRVGNDEEMMKYISSANIACGFHSGDPSTMRQTVRRCLEHGVAIGAHPGLPDLAGFGRREMAVTAEEVHDMVLYQVGALSAFVKAEGGVLSHVKPHGALYNMAAKNRKLADAIAQAVHKLDASLVLYGLSQSELIRAGERIGLRCANEVFADRTYQADGSLTPRHVEGAVIEDASEAANQVVHMIERGTAPTAEGQLVPIQADTVCLHGDGSHAVQFARTITDELMKRGCQIKSLRARQFEHPAP